MAIAPRRAKLSIAAVIGAYFRWRAGCYTVARPLELGETMRARVFRRLQERRRLRGVKPQRNVFGGDEGILVYLRGWLPLVLSPPRPAPGSCTPARAARKRPVEQELNRWEREFLLAPDEPPPPSLPLVFSLPPPCSPPRHDGLEPDLAAWAEEFLQAPDDPPPSLPLVFSLPPPQPPPRREPSLMPVAA